MIRQNKVVCEQRRSRSTRQYSHASARVVKLINSKSAWTLDGREESSSHWHRQAKLLMTSDCNPCLQSTRRVQLIGTLSTRIRLICPDGQRSRSVTSSTLRHANSHAAARHHCTRRSTKHVLHLGIFIGP